MHPDIEFSVVPAHGVPLAHDMDRYPTHRHPVLIKDPPMHLPVLLRPHLDRNEMIHRVELIHQRLIPETKIQHFLQRSILNGKTYGPADQRPVTFTAIGKTRLLVNIVQHFLKGSVLLG